LLHQQAYEKIRAETNLPARLVTLGLRDRANYKDDALVRRIPLDDKLFAIKSPTMLTISTVRGRALIPFHVPGYLTAVESPFPAHLIAAGGSFEIHIAVKSRPIPPEEKTMIHEGILARMGRLLAGLANQAIDNAEGGGRVALVKQAIREIDAGADEARNALGKSRAEEFRLKSRQREMREEVAVLNEKIRAAISEDREDLARAGVARQIDIESQSAALERALDFVELDIEEQTKALQAMLSARREADARLADLENSLARHSPHEAGGAPRVSKTASAERAIAAISRVTGVPAASAGGGKDLDELDRLHREQAIAARLAQIKSSQ
jgi:phage shock protein A